MNGLTATLFFSLTSMPPSAQHAWTALLDVVQFLSLQTELQRKDYKSLYCARPSPIPPNIEGSFLWSIARKVLLYDNKRNQLIIGES